LVVLVKHQTKGPNGPLGLMRTSVMVCLMRTSVMVCLMRAAPPVDVHGVAQGHESCLDLMYDESHAMLPGPATPAMRSMGSETTAAPASTVMCCRQDWDLLVTLAEGVACMGICPILSVPPLTTTTTMLTRQPLWSRLLVACYGCIARECMYVCMYVYV
jgi:hypothetical protein